jgi:phage terminase small subunit
MEFLSKNGILIFETLKKHCKSLKMMDADDLELAMLANSFDLYSQAAIFCRDKGNTFEMQTKTGAYPMMRPEYNVMKNEYQQILKHAGKFGLNPGDRMKIFKGIGDKKPRALEAKMRAAS